jgi:hypothetical protein
MDSIMDGQRVYEKGPPGAHYELSRLAQPVPRQALSIVTLEQGLFSMDIEQSSAEYSVRHWVPLY